jgi:hypothetical protein
LNSRQAAEKPLARYDPHEQSLSHLFKPDGWKLLARPQTNKIQSYSSLLFMK